MRIAKFSCDSKSIFDLVVIFPIVENFSNRYPPNFTPVVVVWPEIKVDDRRGKVVASICHMLVRRNTKQAIFQ